MHKDHALQGKQRSGADVERLEPLPPLDDIRPERERREMLWAAANELPDIFREVFIRIELDGMGMPEVAQELGITLNTGHTRLHLARACFLGALQRFLAGRRLIKDDL